MASENLSSINESELPENWLQRFLTGKLDRDEHVVVASHLRSQGIGGPEENSSRMNRARQVCDGLVQTARNLMNRVFSGWHSE